MPKPDDVPEKPRGLSDDAIEALRPLVVHVGPETRSTDKGGRWNGYRKKVQMIRFSWAEKSVEDKLEEIRDKAMRKKAKKAFKYLCRCNESEYVNFWKGHEKTREPEYQKE